MDAGTAAGLLSNYADVARGLDVSALRRIYPRLPQAMAQRIDGLRRNFSQCEYRFSNVQMVTSTPTSVIVRADSSETCKPRTAQRALPLPNSRYEFHLVKGAAGSWIFEDVFFQ